MKSFVFGSASLLATLLVGGIALGQAQSQPPRDPDRPRQPVVQQQNQNQNQQNPAQVQAGTSIQGKIVSLGENQMVVRTQDNRNVTLYTTPQSRYLVNNKAAQFTDLRVGSTINTTYTTQDNRFMVNSLTVGPAAQAPVPQPAAKPTIVEGTVVKVVGNDQVVVKTTDNKEVVIYVNPQTKYLVNEQPVQFSTFTPGYPVRVEYDVHDNRFLGRRIFGRRR